ncbi:MAG TPA: ACP S-malonyltransferase, partial [Rhizomicrobium sp.]|nr:ACP S-malonyltransferase [Rhizomicrobium sp.]
MTRALIFPGQGSQSVGMGKAVADAFAPAREVFQEVDDALSQKLSTLMWEGPESDLVLTENAQPAIMAASIAIVRVMQKEASFDLARHVRLVAGHSLGEYSALCAAGAFSLADAARLLKARGRAMQSAVPVGEGGMSALLGAEIDQAEKLAKECAAATGGVCVVANDNAPGQV